MIYEPLKGVSFIQAVKDLKEILKKEKSLYRELLFNELYVTVSVDSNEDDMCKIYNLKHEIRQLKAQADYYPIPE